MHHFHPSILREYDIRGIVGETLHDADAYAIGTSFAQIVSSKGGMTIALGFDGRLSSPSLSAHLANGICDAGLDVINLGMCPSPLTYFAGHTVKDIDATIMITGSHNPGDYNGFKFTLHKKAFFGDDIQKIGVIAGQDFIKSSERGSIKALDIKEAYLDRLIQDLPPLTRPLKIAWDCGNGATATVIHDLTKKIKAEHVFLFDTIDGTFPNHHPDPTVEKNLQDLIQTVKEQKCDLGFAFDGDGDRIGVVDQEGTIIWPDALITLYARHILKTHKGAAIIGDVKCSNVTFNAIKETGGTPIIWKTGHSNIKSKMLETSAVLAGELSGHIFFADHFYGYDDSLYCAIRLLAILESEQKTLAELTADLPKTISTPEIRLEVDESKKFTIVETLKTKAIEDPSWETLEIDGLRCHNGLGWWIVRASNTQNVLSIRAEAKDAPTLEKIKDHINLLLEKSGAPRLP